MSFDQVEEDILFLDQEERTQFDYQPYQTAREPDVDDLSVFTFISKKKVEVEETEPPRSEEIPPHPVTLSESSSLPLAFGNADARAKELEKNKLLTTYRKITSFEQLPIFQLKSSILDLLSKNTVLLVCCGTGYGKSTQIPQYLIESTSSTRAYNERVWMAIPRQHVASSLASRISQELDFKRKSTLALHESQKALAESNEFQLSTDSPFHLPPIPHECTVSDVISAPQTNLPPPTTNELFIVHDMHAVEQLAMFIQHLQSQVQQYYIEAQSCHDLNAQINGSSECFQNLVLPFTTLIVDEIHERTVSTDILLGLFLHYYRLLTTINHPQLQHIKLVIMSATMSVSGLFDFFNYNLNMIQSTTPPPTATAQRAQQIQQSQKPPQVHILSTYQPPELPPRDSSTSHSQDYIQAQKLPSSNPHSIPLDQIYSNYLTYIPISNTTVFPVDIEYLSEYNYDYIHACAQKCLEIHQTKPTGDIIVFLPTHQAITQCEHIFTSLLHSFLSANPQTSVLSDNEYYDLLDIQQEYEQRENQAITPILTTLPPSTIYDLVIIQVNNHSIDKQNTLNRLYAQTTASTRKIIFSTSICETSITLPNVVYVIDSGLTKMNVNNVADCSDTALVSVITQAQAVQRCGRAGRCRPGICYRMYTYNNYNTFTRHNIPEIKRCNITPLLLTLGNYGINYYHCILLQPPPSFLINSTYQLLLFYDLFQQNPKTSENSSQPQPQPFPPVQQSQQSQQPTENLSNPFHETYTITPAGRLLYALSTTRTYESKSTPLTNSINSSNSTREKRTRRPKPISFHFARLLIFSRYFSQQCGHFMSILVAYLIVLANHHRDFSDDEATLRTTQSSNPPPQQRFQQQSQQNDQQDPNPPPHLAILTCHGCKQCQDFPISANGDLITVLTGYLCYRDAINKFSSKSLQFPLDHSELPNSFTIPTAPHLNVKLFVQIHREHLRLLSHPLIRLWFQNPSRSRTYPQHLPTSTSQPTTITSTTTTTATTTISTTSSDDTQPKPTRKSRWGIDAIAASSNTSPQTTHTTSNHTTPSTATSTSSQINHLRPFSDHLQPLEPPEKAFFTTTLSSLSLSKLHLIQSIVSKLSPIQQLQYAFLFSFSRNTALNVPLASTDLKAGPSSSFQHQHQQHQHQQQSQKYELRSLFSNSTKLVPSRYTSTNLYQRSAIFQQQSQPQTNSASSSSFKPPSSYVYYNLGANQRVNHLISFEYSWLQPLHAQFIACRNIAVLDTLLREANLTSATYHAMLHLHNNRSNGVEIEKVVKSDQIVQNEVNSTLAPTIQQQTFEQRAAAAKQRFLQRQHY